MKTIHILLFKESKLHFLGLYYGYWNLFFYFKNALKKIGLEVKFFSKINDEFFSGDYLFLNSRYFKYKKNSLLLDEIKKIKNKNENLIWFDMRDSAGTTQFEVLPYVKKYVKKQYYVDKSIYFQNLYGGRLYTNYYHENNGIIDKEIYEQEKLDNKYINKLILGWNLGVVLFFDFTKFSKLDYCLEFIKHKILNKNSFEKSLTIDENLSFKNKKYNIISLMNTNFDRETVGYQRYTLKDKLKKKNYQNSLIGKRLNKKDYYNTMKNSRVSVGAYGWGEVCYREFEATRCGATFTVPDMSNIETWPNIYLKNETYLPYSLDFSNLFETIEELLNNKELRMKLIKNSQTIIKDVHSEIGKNYFLKKIQEIIS